MKSFLEFIREEGEGGGCAPTTTVGSGAVATYSAPMGIPILRRKKKKVIKEDCGDESKFSGHQVFDVKPEVFHNNRFGKKPYSRWAKAVGEDRMDIKDYAQKKRKTVIIRDTSTGSMSYFLKKKAKSPHHDS